MDLEVFSAEYQMLPATEQAQFAEAVKVLLADGLIWRDEVKTRPVYNFLHRRTNLVKDYLSLAGWQLLYHEQIQIFQVVHTDGAHRKRLKQDTTICLLLVRMLYAEQQESTTLRLTRYPAVTIGEINRRYHELPHTRRRWNSKLEEALRELQQLSLIRVADGGSLSARLPQQVIELLPTLEVVIPAGNAQQVAERLAEYFVAKENGNKEFTLDEDDKDEFEE